MKKKIDFSAKQKEYREAMSRAITGEIYQSVMPAPTLKILRRRLKSALVASDMAEALCLSISDQITAACKKK